MSTDSYQIALATFDQIQSLLPRFGTRLDLEPEDVDLELEIPAQPGLDFEVLLSLQNEDELHLFVGPLWVEWFPCTDPEEVQDYIDAVIGLVSGRFRIVEQFRGKRPIRADLQRPVDDGWENLATWATLSLPIARKRLRVIQNATG